MTEDLSIQAGKQTSPTPYVLGGAALGGVAGGIVANYTTKPKYSSYEDIIKETKDNFEKAAKDAISDEAEQTKAINAYQAGVDAGNKWENDKKAYIDANKGGAVIPDDNYKKLEADLETATRTLEDRRTALINEEVERLNKNNTGSLTDRQKEVADELNKKIGDLETSKNNYIAKREKAIDTVNTEISKPRTRYSYTEFGKTINSEGNAFEQLVQRKKTFEATIKSVNSHLRDRNFKRGSELTFVDPNRNQVVTRVPRNAREVKLARKYFEDAYQKDLASMFAGVDKDILNSVADEAAVVVQNNITNNESVASQEALLRKTANEYTTAKAAIPTDAEVLTEFKQSVKTNSNLKHLLDRYSKATDPNVKAAAMDSIRTSYFMNQGVSLQGKKAELETYQLYKKIQRAEELFAKENGSLPAKTWLGRALGLENPALTREEAKELNSLQGALTDAEKKLGSEEFQKIETKARSVKNVNSEISRLESEIQTLDDMVKAEKNVAKITKQVEEWAGKGAKIGSSGNILKADGSVFVPEATTNLASRVGVPKNDPNVAQFDRQIAELRANVPTEGTVLTKAEILERARANVSEEALRSESDAQKLAQKALDDARANLPKGEAKTEDQLAKEFIEKNGEKIEAQKKAFGEDVKALLEKKISNKKMLGFVASGAAVLALLGYAIAPKNNN